MLSDKSQALREESKETLLWDPAVAEDLSEEEGEPVTWWLCWWPDMHFYWSFWNLHYDVESTCIWQFLYIFISYFQCNITRTLLVVLLFLEMVWTKSTLFICYNSAMVTSRYKVFFSTVRNLAKTWQVCNLFLSLNVWILPRNCHVQPVANYLLQEAMLKLMKSELKMPSSHTLCSYKYQGKRSILYFLLPDVYLMVCVLNIYQKRFNLNPKSISNIYI